VAVLAVCAIAACGEDPLGHFNKSHVPQDERTVIGRIFLLNDQRYRINTQAHVCFQSMVSAEEKCGLIRHTKGYLKYDAERSDYDYVFVTLPPGPVRLTSIDFETSDSRLTYSFANAMDFTLLAGEKGTYIGDIYFILRNTGKEIPYLDIRLKDNPEDITAKLYDLPGQHGGLFSYRKNLINAYGVKIYSRKDPRQAPSALAPFYE